MTTCEEPDEWRPVANWPEYEISRLGKIRRSYSTLPVRIRAHGGYLLCTLSRSDPPVRKNGIIHRLVALTFVDNPDPERKTQVNHINGNKQDASAANLEWVSPKENIEHAHRTGLMAGNPRRSRKVVSIDPITEEETIYNSASEAGIAVGVDKARVLICLKQPRSRAAGLHWKLHPTELPVSANWKPLVECDGHRFEKIAYEISDLGEVRNTKDQRLLRPTTTQLGYRVVNLTVDGQSARRLFSVHRLVATVFGTPPMQLEGYDVDHINSDPSDNRACNLQWLSKKAHMEKTVGRRIEQLEDGEVIAIFGSIMAASKSTGLSYSRLCHALSKSGTTGGFEWRDAVQPHAIDLYSAETEQLLRELLDGLIE